MLTNQNNLLTVADILRGGVQRAAVPSLGGEICYLPISASAMIKFQAERAAAVALEAAGGDPKHVERMVEMLVKQLVNPDGSPMFASVEQLSEASVVVLTDIFKVVTGQTAAAVGGEDPNASGGAPGSASPTESLPS